MEPMGADLLRNVRSINDLNRVLLSLRRGDNPLLYYRTVSAWAALRGLGLLFPSKYLLWSQLAAIRKSRVLLVTPLRWRIRGASLGAHLAHLVERLEHSIRMRDRIKFQAVIEARRSMKLLAGFSPRDIANISGESALPPYKGCSKNVELASEIVLVIGPIRDEPGMDRLSFALHWPVWSTKFVFFSLESFDWSDGGTWKEAHFRKISAEIRLMLAGSTHSRLGIVGVSAGGAPALILGSLLNADYVIAAGPTFPHKFPMFLEALRLGAVSTFMEIVYASECIKDEEAARSWLTLVPGISQRPIATGNHLVLAHLAEEQKLTETLESFMGSLRSSKTK